MQWYNLSENEYYCVYRFCMLLVTYTPDGFVSWAVYPRVKRTTPLASGEVSHDGDPVAKAMAEAEKWASSMDEDWLLTMREIDVKNEQTKDVTNAVYETLVLIVGGERKGIAQYLRDLAEEIDNDSVEESAIGTAFKQSEAFDTEYDYEMHQGKPWEGDFPSLIGYSRWDLLMLHYEGRIKRDLEVAKQFASDNPDRLEFKNPNLDQ